MVKGDCSAGDVCSVPGLGRIPKEREWLVTPLLFLPGGNSMDREA